MQQARSLICNVLLCVLVFLACCAPAGATEAQVTQPECVKNSNFIIVGLIGLIAGGAIGVPGLKEVLLLGI